MEALTPDEEVKWEEHKRFLDMQKNRVKIYESPDGGKTVFERYFGEDHKERRQIEPKSEKTSAFIQYGKDEHEVFINPETLDLISDKVNEMTEPSITEVEDQSFDNDVMQVAKKIMEEHKEILEKLDDNNDMVDHPPHYNKGIETSDYIRSWEMNWDQANVVKYVTRYNLKHSDKSLQCQDLRKARHYLDRLIESYDND